LLTRNEAFLIAVNIAMLPSVPQQILKDARGRPTLRPSVWLRTGCRSHFWIRDGRVEWCA
jgi:hypothetical protein